ncbi:hypothetical protein EB093_08190 [bacterium]|nr:hypothetical protein [bacterium]
MIHSIISKASLDLSPAAASKFLAWSSTVDSHYFVVDPSATLGVESKTAFLNPVTIDGESKFVVDNEALTTVADRIHVGTGERYNGTVLRAAFEDAMRSQDDIELKTSILAPVVVAYHLDVIATRVDTELRDAIKGLKIKTKLDASIERLSELSKLMGRLQLMIDTLKQVDREFSLHGNTSVLKPLDLAADEAFDGKSTATNRNFLVGRDITDMTQHEVYFAAVKNVVDTQVETYSGQFEDLYVKRQSDSENFQSGVIPSVKRSGTDRDGRRSVAESMGSKGPHVVPLLSNQGSKGRRGGTVNLDEDPAMLESRSTTSSENSSHLGGESSHSETHSDDDLSTVASHSDSHLDGEFTRSGSGSFLLPPPPPTQHEPAETRVAGTGAGAPLPIPPAVCSRGASQLATNLGGSRVLGTGATENRNPTQGPSLNHSQIGSTLLPSPLPTSAPPSKLNPFTISRPSTVDSELEDGHSSDDDEIRRSGSNSDHSVRSSGDLIELEEIKPGFPQALVQTTGYVPLVDEDDTQSLGKRGFFKGVNRALANMCGSTSSRSSSPTSDSQSSDSGFKLLLPILPTAVESQAGGRRT